MPVTLESCLGLTSSDRVLQQMSNASILFVVIAHIYICDVFHTLAYCPILAPVTTTDYDDPVTTKNNSITSDFLIISGVVLQIFCIFLVSLSTFYYLCGINTFIYVRENIKIAGN